MSLTKRAFVRGINDELIRLGYVRYSDKIAADEIADAVGDQMPEEPAAEPVSPETAADVAATLVDAANKLVEETSGAGLAEEGAPPMAEEEELKTSAAQDLDTRAYNQGYACLVKAAQEAEKRATGSTIEGGDKGNTLSDAAATTGEGKVEADRRPDGYANVGVDGVGDTSHPAGRDPGAQVGTEEAHPDQPGASDAGAVPPASGNTVVEQSKSSSLRAIIQKVAMGTTIEGGDKGNTLDQAAALTGEGKLEADRRPMGYAHMGKDNVGQTETPIGRDPQSSVGHEMDHPDKPKESPPQSTPDGGAGNTVVEQSQASKESAYMNLFTQTAQKVASLLPNNLDQDMKIAHIRQMMGLTDSEQTEYIGMLHKEAGASDEAVIAATEKAAACMRERRRYSGNPNRQDRRRTNQKTAMTPAQEKLPEALKNAIKGKEGNGNGNGNGKEEAAPPPKKEEKKDESAEAGKEMPFEEKEGMDLLSRIRHISQSVRA
jgi:hypothetical protein